MKKNTAIFLSALVAITALFWSCKRQLELVAPVNTLQGYAFLKVADYAPNFRGAVNNRDSFNVYVNGVKVNGDALSYAAQFPAVTNPYAAVAPGTQSIRITVNGVTTPDSVTIATFTKTLNAGSYYSFFITDSLLKGIDSKQIFVQDIFARADTQHYSIRFAHLIMNDTVGKNVDVYSYRLAGNMFSNVSPGTVTPFTVQNNTIASDTLVVRRAGSTFELARLNTAVLARERAYTLVYKGLPNTTTGTKPRSLNIITNL